MTGAQKKKIRRIMIAAPKSGSGKTTITCGLLQIFKENGEDISSCKCGPDYIDPMFHRQVLGIPARNLDTFFTGEDGTRRLFLILISSLFQNAEAEVVFEGSQRRRACGHGRCYGIV